MELEDYKLRLEGKIFHELVGNSSVQTLQVSHVRDLALEAAEILIAEMEFYNWKLPTKKAL